MCYYLSLGANLGDREDTIRQALKQIEQQIGSIPRCSSFFYSEPWGFESEHGFCNICCAVETELAPLEMLRATQAIERALGRTHKSENGVYADRTIDIDLIRAFDKKGKEVRLDIRNQKSEVRSQDSGFRIQKSEVRSQKSEVRSQKSLLTLPHPLWKEREFVKIPLAEVLPDGE